MTFSLAQNVAINEKTSLLVTVSYFDDTGAAVQPSTMSYRIDDNLSGTQVLADTVVVPSQETQTIELTPALNALLFRGNTQEPRKMTLKATYATTRQITGEYNFIINRLDDFNKF